MGERRYTQRRRAERQQRTRERIVDAAVALHEELGPAATTISALAERAGVQRLTVYRHFPTHEELFGACSSKWFSLHPPPDMTSIVGEAGVGHARSVLRALYDYYGATRKMWSSVYRDVGKVAAIEAPLAHFEAYLAEVSNALLSDWRPENSLPLQVTLSHAVRFSTWKSLAERGLDSGQMAELISAWAEAAARAADADGSGCIQRGDREGKRRAASRSCRPK